VPSIMRVMLRDVTRHLKRGARTQSRVIEVLHPESEIAELLRRHAGEHPDVSMGSYPKTTADGRWTAELVLRSPDEVRLAEVADALNAKLTKGGFSIGRPLKER